MRLTGHADFKEKGDTPTSPVADIFRGIFRASVTILLNPAPNPSLAPSVSTGVKLFVAVYRNAERSLIDFSKDTSP
jgi:hypothetical protein